MLFKNMEGKITEGTLRGPKLLPVGSWRWRRAGVQQETALFTYKPFSLLYFLNDIEKLL